MSENKIVRLFRYVVYFSALLTLGTVVGLYAVKVALEDRRPMVLRIESALPAASKYRVNATFETPQQGKRYPMVRFGGLGADGTLEVPAGEVRDLKVWLDVPGGFMSIVKNEIATGDLKGTLHVQSTTPLPKPSGQEERSGWSIPLDVHVASAWETWWPTIFVLAIALAAFVLLYLLSLMVLWPPKGRLVVLDKENGEQIRMVGGTPIEYDLSDRRLHWRKFFWMRDLIRVNTGWSHNITIDLPGGASVDPFVLQFASAGPLLSCPHGQLQVYESATSDTPIHVADQVSVARWRKRCQASGEEMTEGQSADEGQELQDETPSGGSLFFGKSEPSEVSETVDDEEQELLDCVLLDHGARIVSGEYLIAYWTTDCL